MRTETNGSEVSALLVELQSITDDARAIFGQLSERQVNWKPSAEQWSVGQCFDHLIKTNGRFFPKLEQLARGEHQSTLWERLSPFSGIFGRMMLKSLAPDSSRKFKAPPGIQPATSDIDASVISRFAEHQNELAEKIRRATAVADPEKTIVTSPVAKAVTYSLRDALRILVVHERRHFEQARRVTQTEGFPAGA